MSETTVSRTPRSYWLICGVGLLYNGAGVVNFISQMDPGSVAALPESYRFLVEARPSWATIAFAVAVFGGVMGCLFLLARKSVAYYVFGASLAGAIASMAHTLGLNGSADIPAGFIFGNLVQLGVTSLLIWYSVRAEHKGWIH